MGKTGFLLSIGNRIAQKHKTQLISLENSLKRVNQYNLSDSILINDSYEINVERLSELIAKNDEIDPRLAEQIDPAKIIFFPSKWQAFRVCRKS